MPDNIRKPKETSGPLLIGTAGSSGAALRLEQTLTVVRDIARPAMPLQFVGETARFGGVNPIDSTGPLSKAELVGLRNLSAR